MQKDGYRKGQRHAAYLMVQYSSQDLNKNLSEAAALPNTHLTE